MTNIVQTIIKRKTKEIDLFILYHMNSNTNIEKLAYNYEQIMYSKICIK
jgi:hypothetical protein